MSKAVSVPAFDTSPYSIAGPLSERCPAALHEAQQPGEVPLFNPRHVRSRVLHGSV